MVVWGFVEWLLWIVVLLVGVGFYGVCFCWVDGIDVKCVCDCGGCGEGGSDGGCVGECCCFGIKWFVFL